MKELSPKVKGRFDSKRASALVQEALKWPLGAKPVAEGSSEERACHPRSEA
jgi:hypothetical protein